MTDSNVTTLKPRERVAKARDMVLNVLDANADRVQGWLDLIEKQQGARNAFQCYLELLEFGVPRLARTELTGKDGEKFSPAVVNVTIAGTKV